MVPRDDSIDGYCRRYERTVAAIIAFSLGYATPQCAATILRDAHERRQNYCEWIHECYRADPLPAVRAAIRSRHALTGGTWQTTKRRSRSCDERTTVGSIPRSRAGSRPGPSVSVRRNQHFFGARGARL